MTKDEIKKALECCISTEYDCDHCPYYYYDECTDKLLPTVGHLITEQEKEIERLKVKCEEQESEIDKLEGAVKENDERCFDCPQVKQAQIDVLNELRNKCHNYYPSIDHYCCSVKAVNLSDINKMIEELEK